MKRETCLKKAEQRIEEMRIQRDIIATIPLNTPVLINYRCPIKSMGWTWSFTKLVCEIFDFNNLSLRATIIAVENAEAYPFDNDLVRRQQNRMTCIVYPLGFKKIDTWEHFNRQDLPLLLGWPNQYPRLAELLKGT
ncbi:MAG: hypothetical protein NT096_00085 [Proteobacteria bacterium]|nr:hypothetical protein [Pseudomonadota bacterium]